jgi:hypothetical protein
VPKMEHHIVSAQDCEAENAFSRFTDYLEKWLKAGWRVTPGTYHSATSKRTPRMAGYSSNLIKDSYTPVFMICVQVEREMKDA